LYIQCLKSNMLALNLLCNRYIGKEFDKFLLPNVT
jgi:hypothetical protein